MYPRPLTWCHAGFLWHLDTGAMDGVETFYAPHMTYRTLGPTIHIFVCPDGDKFFLEKTPFLSCPLVIPLAQLCTKMDDCLFSQKSWVEL